MKHNEEQLEAIAEQKNRRRQRRRKPTMKVSGRSILTLQRILATPKKKKRSRRRKHRTGI